MSRDRDVYLEDALAAAKWIQSKLQGWTQERFQSDDVMQAAIERKLGIVGEAINVSRKLDSAVEDGIQDVRKIVGMRNFLIHVYHAVMTDTVWNVCQSHIPVLIQDLENLIGAAPPNSAES